MNDIARIHGSVPYFGLWAWETADDYGTRDALACLADAVEQTMERCMRFDPETLDALDYLEARSGCRPALLRRFRTALAEPEAVKCRQAVGDAYAAICRAVAFRR